METMVLKSQALYPLDHFTKGSSKYVVQVNALSEMNKIAELACEQVTYAMGIYERVEAMIPLESTHRRALKELTYGYLQSIAGVVRESHQALWQIIDVSFRRMFVIWMVRFLVRKPKPSMITGIKLDSQRKIYSQTQNYVQRIESLAAAMHAKG